MRLPYPFRNIYAELFHLVLKVFFVVTQRAFEEVARRLGQRLDAVPVIPSVAARGPQIRVAQELSVALALLHILLGDVVETNAARRRLDMLSLKRQAALLRWTVIFKKSVWCILKFKP